MPLPRRVFPYAVAACVYQSVAAGRPRVDPGARGCERGRNATASGRRQERDFFVAHPSAPPAFLATRFTAMVAMLFVLLGALQLAASLFFYHAIDRQALRDDHARRIAELLVVSDRLYAVDPGGTPAAMSTRYLSAGVGDRPVRGQPDPDGAPDEIARKIVSWEPSLAGRELRLSIDPAGHGRHDLVGSIRLKDRRWLNFRSRDVAPPWPVASRAVAITLASGAAGLLVGLLVLHVLGLPLRRLAAAAGAIGHGRTVEIREQGTRDLRDLAHAMNAMQARIGRLLRDQAKSFEAISHDLRTPLARQKLAADLVEDAELGAILRQSVGEMESLLASLQQFLRAQHLMADPETVDLAELARGVAAPWAERARLVTPGPVMVTTVVEPLRLALAALIENAVQFGTRATIEVHGPSHIAPAAIIVEDEGPGLDPAYFEDVLDPFFRLDEARARDTSGFGLGIPTAHRLMARFDGRLSFARGAGGGLLARIDVPPG